MVPLHCGVAWFNGALLCFGGSTDDGRADADPGPVLQFLPLLSDGPTGWTAVDTVGRGPTACLGPVVIPSATVVTVAGGALRSGKTVAEVWELDLGSRMWAMVPYPNMALLPAFAASVDGPGGRLLHGGVDTTGALTGRLLRLDPDGRELSVLRADLPPLAGHQMVHAAGCLVLFGGHGPAGDNDAVVWAAAPPSSAPWVSVPCPARGFVTCDAAGVVACVSPEGRWTLSLGSGDTAWLEAPPAPGFDTVLAAPGLPRLAHGDAAFVATDRGLAVVRATEVRWRPLDPRRCALPRPPRPHPPQPLVPSLHPAPPSRPSTARSGGLVALPPPSPRRPGTSRRSKKTATSAALLPSLVGRCVLTGVAMRQRAVSQRRLTVAEALQAVAWPRQGEALDLTPCPLQPADFVLLQETLEHSPHVTALTLANHGPLPEFHTALFLRVLRASSLTTLRCAGTSFEPEPAGTVAVEAALRDNTLASAAADRARLVRAHRQVCRAEARRNTALRDAADAFDLRTAALLLQHCRAALAVQQAEHRAWVALAQRVAFEGLRDREARQRRVEWQQVHQRRVQASEREALEDAEVDGRRIHTSLEAGELSALHREERTEQRQLAAALRRFQKGLAAEREECARGERAGRAGVRVAEDRGRQAIVAELRDWVAALRRAALEQRLEEQRLERERRAAVEATRRAAVALQQARLDAEKRQQAERESLKVTEIRGRDLLLGAQSEARFAVVVAAHAEQAEIGAREDTAERARQRAVASREAPAMVLRHPPQEAVLVEGSCLPRVLLPAGDAAPLELALRVAAPPYYAGGRLANTAAASEPTLEAWVSSHSTMSAATVTVAIAPAVPGLHTTLRLPDDVPDEAPLELHDNRYGELRDAAGALIPGTMRVTKAGALVANVGPFSLLGEAERVAALRRFRGTDGSATFGRPSAGPALPDDAPVGLLRLDLTPGVTAADISLLLRSVAVAQPCESVASWVSLPPPPAVAFVDDATPPASPSRDIGSAAPCDAVAGPDGFTALFDVSAAFQPPEAGGEPVRRALAHRAVVRSHPPVLTVPKPPAPLVLVAGSPGLQPWVGAAVAPGSDMPVLTGALLAASVSGRAADAGDAFGLDLPPASGLAVHATPGGARIVQGETGLGDVATSPGTLRIRLGPKVTPATVALLAASVTFRNSGSGPLEGTRRLVLALEFPNSFESCAEAFVTVVAPDGGPLSSTVPLVAYRSPPPVPADHVDCVRPALCRFAAVVQLSLPVATTIPPGSLVVTLANPAPLDVLGFVPTGLWSAATEQDPRCPVGGAGVASADGHAVPLRWDADTFRASWESPLPHDALQDLIASCVFRTDEPPGPHRRLLPVALRWAGGGAHATCALRVADELLSVAPGGTRWMYKEQADLTPIGTFHLGATEGDWDGGELHVELVRGHDSDDVIAIKESLGGFTVGDEPQKAPAAQRRSAAGPRRSEDRPGPEEGRPPKGRRKSSSVAALSPSLSKRRATAKLLELSRARLRSEEDVRASAAEAASARRQDTTVRERQETALWFGEQRLGTVVMTPTSLAVAFAARRDPRGRPVVRRRDVIALLKAVCYRSVSDNPDVDAVKVFAVRVRDSLPHASVCSVEVGIEAVDDATEIRRERDEPRLFIAGGMEDQLGFAPFDDATLFDPDTFAFNGALLTVEVQSGGDPRGGDALVLLDPTQLATRGVPPASMLAAEPLPQSDPRPTAVREELPRASGGVAVVTVATGAQPERAYSLCYGPREVGRLVCRPGTTAGPAALEVRFAPYTEGKRYPRSVGELEGDAAAISIIVVEAVLRSVAFTTLALPPRPGMRTLLATLNFFGTVSGVTQGVEVAAPTVYGLPRGPTLAHRLGGVGTPVFPNLSVSAVDHGGVRRGTVRIALSNPLPNDKLELGGALNVLRGGLYNGKEFVCHVQAAEHSFDLSFDWNSNCTRRLLQDILRGVTFTAAQVGAARGSRAKSDAGETVHSARRFEATLNVEKELPPQRVVVAMDVLSGALPLELAMADRTDVVVDGPAVALCQQIVCTVPGATPLPVHPPNVVAVSFDAPAPGDHLSWMGFSMLSATEADEWLLSDDPAGPCRVTRQHGPLRLAATWPGPIPSDDVKRCLRTLVFHTRAPGIPALHSRCDVNRRTVTVELRGEGPVVRHSVQVEVHPRLLELPGTVLRDGLVAEGPSAVVAPLAAGVVSPFFLSRGGFCVLDVSPPQHLFSLQLCERGGITLRQPPGARLTVSQSAVQSLVVSPTLSPMPSGFSSGTQAIPLHVHADGRKVATAFIQENALRVDLAAGPAAAAALQRILRAIDVEAPDPATESSAVTLGVRVIDAVRGAGVCYSVRVQHQLGQ